MTAPPSRSQRPLTSLRPGGTIRPSGAACWCVCLETGPQLARQLGQPSVDVGVGMFFELRQYYIRPGQLGNWVKCMEEEIIPFQTKMGMVIIGSFRGEVDESVYIWIRRFENEEERKRLYDAVYQSDYWKNEIAPRVPTMIDREQIKVTRLVATPRSVIQ